LISYLYFIMYLALFYVFRSCKFPSLPMASRTFSAVSIRRFADIGVETDAIPDDTTILNFWHLLERHELTRKIFEKTQRYLSDKGLLLREGTIVDATVINAPASTKNRDKTRDEGVNAIKQADIAF